MSGTYKHCLVVSNEYRVFGCGSNEFGQIGVGEKISSITSFTEISSLSGHEISEACAGYDHSLFKTRDGKIFACGRNYCGHLLISRSPKDECVYSPTETTITSDATFCVAGSNLSTVFIGGNPPPNTPNMIVSQKINN